jgi:hypothetical protein
MRDLGYSPIADAPTLRLYVRFRGNSGHRVMSAFDPKRTPAKPFHYRYLNGYDPFQ